jgi:hypothetical protein
MIVMSSSRSPIERITRGRRIAAVRIRVAGPSKF